MLTRAVRATKELSMVQRLRPSNTVPHPLLGTVWKQHAKMLRASSTAQQQSGTLCYPDVMAPKPRGEGLPGLTRSTYERDHALITPESRVWCG